MVTNKYSKEDERKKRLVQVNNYDQEYICIMGKNLTPKKLQKRISRKPRLFGPILINISIISMVIIAILLIIGFGGA